jgi:PAS domain S-box-containing protein
MLWRSRCWDRSVLSPVPHSSSSTPPTSTASAALRTLTWVLAAAYAIAAIGWPPSSSRGAAITNDLLFLTLVLSALMSLWLATAATEPGSTERQSWQALTFAYAIPAIGMASPLYHHLMAWGQPPASWPRAIYLVSYLLFWYAIARFPTDRRARREGVARRIDELIIGAVAVVVLSILAYSAIAVPRASVLFRLTEVAFPLGDLTSMYLIIRRLDDVHDRRRRAVLLCFAAALPFDLLVDLFYSQMVQASATTSSLVTAVAYGMPFVLVAQAAFLRRTGRAARRAPTTPPMLFAPTMAVATLWAIVAATLTGIAPLPLPILLVAVGVVTALVVARQLIALRDANQALTARDAAEARFAAVVAHSVDATLLFDETGRCTYASPSTETLLGRPAHAVVGQFICDSVVEEQRDQARALFTAREAGAPVPGSPSGTIWRVQRADRAIRQVEVNVVDRRHDPALKAFVCSARDVTERMAMQAQLRESQTMEVVGRMAGGIAHDFNNLLAVVRGNAELLEMRLDEQSVERTASRIREAAERGAALTQRLLGFTRQDVETDQVVSVDAVLRETRPLIERLVAKGIRIEFLLDASEAWVRIDPVELERAVINLAVNARDAMPQGGRLTIASRASETDVAVMVQDTGEGIDETARARLFEPLFTTKPRGKGTGLGLHITRTAVERVGGTISVDSVLGVGSTFTLSFPRAQQPVDAAPPVGDAPPVSRSEEGATGLAGRRVLLVDDEPSLRQTLAAGLRATGLLVDEVESVDAAEAQLSSHVRHYYDVVVTDMVMPERSGLELISHVRREWPELPVVVISGFTGEIGFDRDSALAGIETLRKPCALRELAGAIERRLPPSGRAA